MMSKEITIDNPKIGIGDAWSTEDDKLRVMVGYVHSAIHEYEPVQSMKKQAHKYAFAYARKLAEKSTVSILMKRLPAIPAVKAMLDEDKELQHATKKLVHNARRHVLRHARRKR